MKQMDQEQVTYQKALQKVHPLEEVRTLLMEHGFLTPFHITQIPKSHFLNQAKEGMGISEREAEKIYQKAKKISQKIMHFYINLRVTLGSPYSQALPCTAFQNEGKENLDFYPDYQALFGSLNYVKGEEKDSIFGPGAYFIDLMRITDQFVTKACKEIPKGYHLEERRPDLEQIRLTGENCEKLIPYLNIVNERLKDAVKTLLSTENPEQLLCSLKYPFELPMNLDYEKIRFLLKAANTSLYEVYQIDSKDSSAAVYEAIGCRKDVLFSYAVPFSKEELGEYYGMPTEKLGELKQVEIFLNSTGLEKEELFSLFHQNLKEDEKDLYPLLFINRGLKGDYLRLEGNEICNLISSHDTMDRVNRFIRVSRLLSLPFEELDWLIRCLSDTGELNQEFFEKAGKVMRLYHGMKIEFYEFTAIFAPFKTYGKNNLFDRVFQQEHFSYHPKNKYNPQDRDNEITWNAQTEEDLLFWLSGCLAFKTSELKQLAEVVWGEKEKKLSLESLSAFYGHTKMAEQLELPFSSYFTLLRLTHITGVLTISQMEMLIEVNAKRKEYQLSFEQADYFINGVTNSYITLRYTKASLSEFCNYTKQLAYSTAEDQSMQRKENFDLIFRALAGFFLAEENQIRGLKTILEKTVKKEDWYLFFQNPKDYGQEIEKLAFCINKWLLVMENQVPIELILCISEHSDLFGIPDLEKITFSQLLSIYQFASYFRFFQDETKQLLSCIAMDEEALYTLTKISSYDILELFEIKEAFFEGLHSVTEKIEKIISIHSLLNRLGVNVAFLKLLASLSEKGLTAYEEIKEIYKKVSLTLKEEQSQKKTRDAFLSLVCWKTGFQPFEVYKYLLIDPQMEEKTRITVIREAINAVQLYLNRCRMGMEKGVKGIDLDENWWSWVLDYNLWKANREIFVYPENYLLPSVRHTKTSLFQEFENGLKQSAVQEEYIEQLYLQYVEHLAQMSEFTIQTAYQKGKELFLFARTRQQPYTFYYCSKKQGSVFGEWEKIESNINTDFITPVFIGNKFCLFFAELKKAEKTNVGQQASTESNTYRVNIRYVYKNMQKQWSTPQDVITEELVFYDENGQNPIRQHPLFQGLYNMSEEAWKKVVVIPIKKKNYLPFQEKEDSFERICIFYGPMLNQEVALSSVRPYSFETTNPDGINFSKKIEKQIRQYKNMIAQGMKGNLTAGFSKVFNLHFEEDYLVRENEYLVLDEYSPMYQASLFIPEIFKLKGILCAGASANPIMQMYYSNKIYAGRENLESITQASFESEIYKIDTNCANKIYNILVTEGVIKDDSRSEWPKVNVDQLTKYNLSEGLIQNHLVLTSIEQVYFIQQVLYSHIIREKLFEGGIENQANFIPVSNQPGAFLFENGEEIFLFTAIEKTKKAAYACLDQGLTVSSPLLSYTTLCQNEKLRDQAGKLLLKLKEAGLVEERYILQKEKCQEKVIRNLVEENAELSDRLYSLLQNDPLAEETIFRDEELGIGEDAAKRIYKKLCEKRIILEGRVSSKNLKNQNLKRVLEDCIKCGDLKGSDLDKIYKKLAFAPIPVSLKYWPKEEYKQQDLFFQLTRISNGAIRNIRYKAELGIKKLLELDTQTEPISALLPFERYKPEKTPIFDLPKAMDGGSVDFEGLYGEYFWELFYHIPSLISDTFQTGYDNASSQTWQQFVFSPINTEDSTQGEAFSPWNFKPFRNHKIEDIYQILSDDQEAISVYQEDPFNPHAVARLRIGAYEKYTLIQYIENRIAWGDQEFIKNSWESLTNAAMHYVTAGELLGKRPACLSERQKKPEYCFQEIKEKYPVIPSFLIDQINQLEEDDSLDFETSIPFLDCDFYFGIPENERLLKLWDLIEDRLYKLRNLLDINGKERSTLLYGKDKDPLQIVKEAYFAPGSFGNLSQLSGKRLPYRFRFLIEQAKNLTSNLISVSTQMLSALEKKDMETLAYVSSNNDRILNTLLTFVKEQQCEELEKYFDSLQISAESAKKRYEYYQGLVETGLSQGEQTSLSTADTAFALSTAANVMKIASSAAYALPQVGSPFAMTYGGIQIGSMLNGMAGAIELGGGIASFLSQRAATMAGYERRKEEWKQQRQIAEYDKENVDLQMEGTKIKIASAKKELEVHKIAIEQRENQLKVLNTKFTNAQLYQWMVGNLNTVMWQSYQLAIHLALKAQEAYQFERSSKETFLTYEYWDASKKGLLSGENLMAALEQMQVAYLKTNDRKLEIEKQISLAYFCPESLQQLKQTGECYFDLTEAMYDADYPGHYMRKIVQISLTIPALVGPYQSIKATLCQIKNSIVVKPDKKGVTYLLENKKNQVPDSVVTEEASSQIIAISRGIEDCGLFQLDFGDERYLPFEGSGAVSSWELKMPKSTNHFDFESISDVYIQMKYQAMFDKKLQKEVEELLKQYPFKGCLSFYLRKDFTKECSLQLNPSDPYLKNKRVTGLYLQLASVGEEHSVVNFKLPSNQLIKMEVHGVYGSVALDVPMEEWKGEVTIEFEDAKKQDNIILFMVYEGMKA